MNRPQEYGSFRGYKFYAEKEIATRDQNELLDLVKESIYSSINDDVVKILKSQYDMRNLEVDLKSIKSIIVILQQYCDNFEKIFFNDQCGYVGYTTQRKII